MSKAPAGEKKPVLVKVKDGLTWGEEVEVPLDLVVLAVGMMPADVSTVRDGLKLSAGTDRFLLEVHPKLRPVELAVSGVLLAGTSQGPKDVTETTASASAAAAKAVVLLSKGHVDLDPFVAHVNADLCEGHATCVAECPVPRRHRHAGVPGRAQPRRGQSGAVRRLRRLRRRLPEPGDRLGRLDAGAVRVDGRRHRPRRGGAGAMTDKAELKATLAKLREQRAATLDAAVAHNKRHQIRAPRDQGRHEGLARRRCRPSPQPPSCQRARSCCTWPACASTASWSRSGSTATTRPISS